MVRERGGFVSGMRKEEEAGRVRRRGECRIWSDT